MGELCGVQTADPRARAPYLALPPTFMGAWRFSVWAYVHHRILDHIDLVLQADDGTPLEITREEAAAAAGISDEIVFSNVFLLAVGMTFRTWVPEARMEHGKHLLYTTKLPIDIIARALGYADGSTFSRAGGSRWTTP